MGGTLSPYSGPLDLVARCSLIELYGLVDLNLGFLMEKIGESSSRSGRLSWVQSGEQGRGTSRGSSALWAATSSATLMVSPCPSNRTSRFGHIASNRFAPPMVKKFSMKWSLSRSS